MKKTLLICLLLIFTAHAADFEKILLYDKYTLAGTYPYKKGTREFQWATISQKLDSIQQFTKNNETLALLTNYKNWRGNAPLAIVTKTDEYGSVVDKYGVPKNQAIPLYAPSDTHVERYGKDGSLVAITDSINNFYIIKHSYIEGIWKIPKKYIKKLDATSFEKVIVIDRTNQNIAALQYLDTTWVVRSMNPATTGLHKPPYQRTTPLGVFVMQNKNSKMIYHADGTKEIGGYAPYANRFCCGGYIHGVPVNLPRTKMIEYSATLGTTPRSHMCVRNATSHAEFIYKWTNSYETLIIVIE